MVSNIGDQYHDIFRPKHWYPQTPPESWPTSPPQIILGPTRAEFDELRKEVLAMKELLKLAKAFDERTGQPDCEVESKIALLRAVAKAVGVDLDDVLKAPPQP